MASNTDWEAIEREYRTGQLSVRELSRQHGVSHVAIHKRAKAEGWSRDLAKQVRQEVNTRLVTSEVNTASAKEAVEQAAQRGVEVVRQHRGSLGRAHAIAERLMIELEHGTENAAEIEEAIEAETIDDKSPKRRNAMLKAVSLPSRAGTLRELSQALKNLIPLERQAFNLDAPAGGDDDDGAKVPAGNDLARRLAFVLSGAA